VSPSGGSSRGTARTPATAGTGAAIDAVGGGFTMGFTTLAVTAARCAPQATSPAAPLAGRA
jgi:hypothetical protein